MPDYWDVLLRYTVLWHFSFRYCRNNCKNKDLCVEKLSLVLPDRPPYVPREFDRCTVAGNSGDHLKTRFGKERESYEIVIRENGAPQSLSFGLSFFRNYAEYVGKKSTIRLLNRESARGLDKVVELDGNDIFFLKILLFTSYAFIILKHDKYMDFTATRKEVLIIKTTIHDFYESNDSGYEEWYYFLQLSLTRYSSESQKGHTPLYGRAYCQMMECLGKSVSLTNLYPILWKSYQNPFSNAKRSKPSCEVGSKS
ncbi:hypothetical protein CXB51_018566 [Gossypium anomalum]|uniref:Uncharacterized protein n=1 Tax=Gossypium anomalum TaxID=47600 RepID=A0A8J5Z3H9_9ROSI|nr:hypothetical protein CXB51_018566 [Gossypium anomalum]